MRSNNNNNVHLSCADQRPECSHDTYINLNMTFYTHVEWKSLPLAWPWECILQQWSVATTVVTRERETPPPAPPPPPLSIGQQIRELAKDITPSIAWSLPGRNTSWHPCSSTIVQELCESRWPSWAVRPVAVHGWQHTVGDRVTGSFVCFRLHCN